MKSNKKATVLHLGCGYEKVTGAIGVDINDRSQADVIHDLNKFPYPFKSNQFERIIAENIIEHLDDIIRVLEELYRISKNKAVLYIKTGHFTSVDSFTDPTHKHFFTTRTFDYFIPGTDLYKYHYSKAKFTKKQIILGPSGVSNFLLNQLLKIINQHQMLYESRFAYLFPVGVITYELSVLK